MVTINLPARNCAVDFQAHGYIVNDCVGSGQFAHAYRVTSEETGEEFLAKSIELTQLVEKDRVLNLQEAQLMPKLKHQNIVTYYDNFMHADAYLVIIMEYCRNRDLAQFIAEKRGSREYISEEEILRMFVQILEALEYIHSMSVIHRDLKPSNIFIDESGNLKIGDFGISRIMSNAHAQTTVGTPQYMCPEMILPTTYTYNADTWSAGCILFEMAALKPAFSAENVFELARLVLDAPVDALPDCYSNNLQQLVSMMLSKDPQTRPLASEILAMPYVASRRSHPEPRRNSLVDTQWTVLPPEDIVRFATVRACRRLAESNVDFIGALRYTYGAEEVKREINTQEKLEGIEEHSDSSGFELHESQTTFPFSPDTCLEDITVTFEWMKRTVEFYHLGLCEGEICALLTANMVDDDDKELSVQQFTRNVAEVMAQVSDTFIEEEIEAMFVNQRGTESGRSAVLQVVQRALCCFRGQSGGTVSRQNFRTAWHISFPLLTTMQLERLFAMADKDFDAGVDVEEFLVRILPMIQAADLRSDAESFVSMPAPDDSVDGAGVMPVDTDDGDDGDMALRHAYSLLTPILSRNGGLMSAAEGDSDSSSYYFAQYENSVLLNRALIVAFLDCAQGMQTAIMNIGAERIAACAMLTGGMPIPSESMTNTDKHLLAVEQKVGRTVQAVLVSIENDHDGLPNLDGEAILDTLTEWLIWVEEQRSWLSESRDAVEEFGARLRTFQDEIPLDGMWLRPCCYLKPSVWNALRDLANGGSSVLVTAGLFCPSKLPSISDGSPTAQSPKARSLSGEQHRCHNWSLRTSMRLLQFFRGYLTCSMSGIASVIQSLVVVAPASFEVYHYRSMALMSEMLCHEAAFIALCGPGMGCVSKWPATQIYQNFASGRNPTVEWQSGMLLRYFSRLTEIESQLPSATETKEFRSSQWLAAVQAFSKGASEVQTQILFSLRGTVEMSRAGTLSTGDGTRNSTSGMRSPPPPGRLEMQRVSPLVLSARGIYRRESPLRSASFNGAWEQPVWLKRGGDQSYAAVSPLRVTPSISDRWPVRGGGSQEHLSPPVVSRRRRSCPDTRILIDCPNTPSTNTPGTGPSLTPSPITTSSRGIVSPNAQDSSCIAASTTTSAAGVDHTRGSWTPRGFAPTPKLVDGEWLMRTRI
eukprot:Polyplicarium_translucidae@DN2990_c0_g1_i3.p1